MRVERDASVRLRYSHAGVERVGEGIALQRRLVGQLRQS